MLYKLFDLYIEICENQPQTRLKLKDYEANVSAEPDIVIAITDEEISVEKQKDPQKSDYYCEMVCIFRHITEEITDFDGIFIHSAVVKKGDEGYFFLGRSGSGKSTHTIGWLKTFSDAEVINGDKPILRFFDDGIYAYGSPWCGIEGFCKNEKVKLLSGAFIEKALTNKIYEIDSKEVFQRLLKQSVAPKDAKRRVKYFEFLDKIIKQLPFYVLECDISKEAVLTAYDKMRRDTK